MICESDVLPGVLSDTTSPSSVRVSQFTMPRSAGTRRSPHSSWACSRESTVMRPHLRTASPSISLRTSELLPAALMWVPSAIHSPLTTGSLALVIVTTTSVPGDCVLGAEGGRYIDAELFGHAVTELGEGLGAAAVDFGSLNVSNRAYSLKLRYGLAPGADHSHNLRPFFCEIFGADTGSRSRAHPAKMVGLDDGEKVSGLGAEEEGP